MLKLELHQGSIKKSIYNSSSALKCMLFDTLVIGCGENQVKKIGRCVAIDISEEYLKNSKRLKPENLYLLADVNKLPFSGKLFNKIICTEVLEHTQNPKKVLSEISRVINKFGTLQISVPLVEACEDLAAVFPAYRRDFYCKYHKSNFTKESLIALFKKTRFISLKINYFGKEIYYFWHIWARLVKIFNLNTYIEENGKIYLDNGSRIKELLFRNLSRTIRVFSFLLSRIIPNENYTSIFVEARK